MVQVGWCCQEIQRMTSVCSAAALAAGSLQAPYLASTSFMRFLKMLRSLVCVSLYSYQACSRAQQHVTTA